MNVKKKGVAKVTHFFAMLFLIVFYKFSIAQDMEAPPVIITATRNQKPLFELSTSVSNLEKENIQTALPNFQPADVLSRIPGVYAKDRGRNFAQDAKIIIRGFGARTQFGVREIKLFWDGVPLTMADGQGDIDKLDMSFIKHIEVLKGPLAVLYGNSAGSVVYFESEDGGLKPLSTQIKISGGSYGFHKENLKLGGQIGIVNYMLGVTSLYSAGFRDHSSARRNYANIKTTVGIADRSSFTLFLHLFDEPFAKDPGALTKEEFNKDPKQASPIYKSQDARENIQNKEVGFLYQHELSQDQSFKITGYFGHRDFTGYTPVIVNDFGRDYYGLGLNWLKRIKVGERKIETTLGIDTDFMKEDRSNFRNASGNKGNLQYTQNSDVKNFGLYTLVNLDITKSLQLSGGARYSRVSFSADYNRFSPSVLFLSSDKSFQSTTYAATLGYKPIERINIYAGVGRGFITPTLIELINSPSGPGGLNKDLKASKFYNYEAGIRALLDSKTYLDTTLFLIRTSDELVSKQLFPGTNYYVNAGKTKRSGLELYLVRELPFNLHTTLSYTYMEAIFKDFTDTDGTDRSGKRIPGIPRHTFFYELSWKPTKNLSASVDVMYADKVWADNSNTASADSYTVVSLKGSYRFNILGYDMNAFLRIENLFDKKYVASIVPNATSGRYYEPGPGRNYYMGMVLDF
jgi:iron complex outermembrane receptor protein